MKYNVPEIGEIEIKTIVLDLNGTLSVNGDISQQTKEKIDLVTKEGVKIILFTGDQRGTAESLCKEIGVEFHRAKSSKEKAELSEKLDYETTAAIGNARIDIGTFKNAKVSVATLQSEGIHVGILAHVDVIVPSIEDALDFFLNENTFCATMRK